MCTFCGITSKWCDSDQNRHYTWTGTVSIYILSTNIAIKVALPESTRASYYILCIVLPEYYQESGTAPIGMSYSFNVPKIYIKSVSIVFPA